MTEKDAKEILRREFYRVVERLSEVDPVLSPELYRELLVFAERLQWFSAEPVLTPMATAEEIVAEVKAEPIPEVEEPTPEPEPEPEPEADKTYSKEEVRAALAESRKKGVNVAELLKEFGAANFTGLPAAKYGELMARLEKL